MPSSEAIRSATDRAAIRRGWVCPIIPFAAAAELQADLRQLRGLARAGLARDDDDLVVADRGGDVVASLADRELGRVGDLELLGGHDRPIVPARSGVSRRVLRTLLNQRPGRVLRTLLNHVLGGDTVRSCEKQTRSPSSTSWTWPPRTRSRRRTPGSRGHEAELPDFTPDGYAQREELLRSARAAMAAATPSDEREQVAKDSFLERADTSLAMHEAHVGQWRVSVIEGVAHEVRGVFDLMATETEDDWAAISTRLAGVPQALADHRATLLHEADQGRVGPRRQLVEAAKLVHGWTGRAGSAAATASVFAQLVAQAGGVPASLESDLARNAVLATHGVRRARDVPRDELAPRGLDEGGGRPRAVRPGLPLLPRRRRSTSTRPTRGAGRSCTASRARCSRSPRGIAGAGATIAGRGRRHRERPAPGHRRRGGLPRLDAGARRPDDRRADRHPLRHPRAGPPDRVPDRADQDGGIYYTGPIEDFSRPGRMWWSVPEGVDDVRPVARGHDGLPRGRAGPPPPGARRRSYRADLLNRWQRACAGSPGTARAGRSTPSG